MRKNRLRVYTVLLLSFLLTACHTAGEKSEEVSNTPDKKETSETTNISDEDITIISRPEIELKESEEKADGKTEKKADTATGRQIAKKGILIALDPGHQSETVDMSASEPNAPGSDVMKTKATGGTSGRYSGIPEYQLNLDIALAVRDRLAADGYDVIMTREDNETAISNAERASLANDAGADISVRIHANGSENSDSNGALTLIGSSDNPYVGHLYEDSCRLAESILNAYCGSTGMQNLGIQTNDTMTGINWSKIPVVILEMGFMTNEQDDLNMADTAYRQKMVEGIAAGINAYYGY